MNTIKKLGVFDSGVGGLTVLRDLAQLPINEIIYCADTLNLPYGQKTKPHIEQLTSHAVSFLVNAGVDAVVLACHTASANAYDFVHAQFPHLQLFDVVNPSIEQALQATRNNRIGIIGTQATIASAIHRAKILSYNAQAHVVNQACPLFVPLIENGLKDTKGLQHAIETYLNPLLENDIDTLVIGCTHYEIIVEHIRNYIGPDIATVSVPPLMQQTLTSVISHPRTQFASHENTIKSVRGEPVEPYEHKISIPIITYLISGNIKQFQNNALNLLNWHIPNDRIKNAHLQSSVVASQIVHTDIF